MDLSNIKILETRKKRKRVGRGAGSGKGKTAGRGHKGQGCRSGGSVHPWFEGGQMPLYRRLPRRGFNNARFKKQFQILNVSDLNGFDSGSEVKPVELYQSGLIEKEYLPVKVLGDGELTVSLTIHAHKFSKSAQEKIEKAGGKISVIEKKVETVKE